MAAKRITIKTGTKRRIRKINDFKYRFVRILCELRNKGYIRVKEIAPKLEVTKRTLERDINILREDSFVVPDELEKGKWLFNAAQHNLDKIDVSDHDAVTLAFLYKFSRVFGGQMSKSVLKAIDKMFVLEETDPPFFMITPRVKKPDMQWPFYKPLYDSIQSRNKINLTYQATGGVKTIKAWPFSFIMCDGMWYLGYLLEPKGRAKQEMRTVRYSHLLKVEPLHEETFEKPAWVKATLKKARNIWFNRDRTTRVVMEASNRVKDYFELSEYFPAQKIISCGKDSFQVEAKICHPNEIIHNLLRFMPEIKVLEPKSIREELHRRVMAYLKK